MIDIDKEAYSTLIEWAESAPLILKELEVKGDQRDIKKFKIHIKLVVQKLQDIQRLMTKNR